MRYIDQIGHKFGEWTVLEDAGLRKWKARCICGVERVMHRSSLRYGKSKSCGCRKTRSHPRHGHTVGLEQSPTWRSWCAMCSRCTNLNATSHENYIDRGITMCTRWSTFENFLEDMGTRPQGHQLDRIDNNGNYEPGNCRWSTVAEQSRNRRTNRMLDLDGETKTLVDWATHARISKGVLSWRLKQGWTLRDALQPVTHKDPSVAAAEAESIRGRYAAGEKQRLIAKAFGYTQSNISAIVRGKSRR